MLVWVTLGLLFALEDFKKHLIFFTFFIHVLTKMLTPYYDPTLAPCGHDLTELESTQDRMLHCQ